MSKKPPKPKDAKEARFRKRNREEDRETYEYLDKQSRRNGPVKKDPPPKPKKKPIKKREGGEVKKPKKMMMGGKVSMPKKMKRGGKVKKGMKKRTKKKDKKTKKRVPKRGGGMMKADLRKP